MIRLSLDGAVARLTIARPEARGAFSLAGWRMLAEAADAVAAGNSAVVILDSTDPASFSAGADIGELIGLDRDAAARPVFREAMRAGIEAVAALPMPAIAAVDGACYGAGVAVAMACDIRIAGGTARFGITPARMGIGYPQQDVARLHDLVGPGQAARLLFGAVTIDAAEAVRIGLAEILADSAVAEAERMARAIAANSAASARLLKRGIAAARSGIRVSPDLDAAFDATFGTPDFQAGTAAFRARRGG